MLLRKTQVWVVSLEYYPNLLLVTGNTQTLVTNGLVWPASSKTMVSAGIPTPFPTENLGAVLKKL